MDSLQKIQPALQTDLHALLAIEEQLFNYDAISLRQMKYLLKSKTALVVKVQSDELVVGYMILLSRINSRVLRIYSLGVLPAAQRLGSARKLLHYAETYGSAKGCEKIHLELHAHNGPALTLYQSTGYSVFGCKDHYYTDGSKALLLRKYIEPGGNHDSPLN
jgi:ribosomal protein S18 acetylase RimI-like enzyme